MSNEAKTKAEEAKRDSELKLDELEAVSGGLTYTLTNVSLSSYSASGHGGQTPSEPIVLH